MKNITCIMLVGAMTGFSALSCQQSSPHRQSLAAAEQIMDEHPDSAYVLLKAIPEENLSKRDYADWCLLITQAMDKQYMDHASDSLIRIAADYFERRGNTARRTKAYYYMGRVNQDLGETQLSQQYYLKALETGRSSGNDRQLALIHSNLGMLYTYQGVYDEALLQMEASARLFRQLGDTVNSAYILRNMGRTFHVMDSIDLSISYYEQALADIDSFGQPSVLTELGDVFITKGSYNEAEIYLREAIQSVSPDDYQLVCLIIGRLFSETGQSDSARFYLNESLNGFRLDTKASAYYYLAKLDQHEGKREESAKSLWSYFELQDVIMKHRDTESIRKIQALFNFNRIEEERNRALQRTIQIERICFLLLMILTGLSITAFIGWKNNQRQKKEREKLIMKHRDQSIDYDQKIRELTSKLAGESHEKEKRSMEIKRLQLKIDQIAFQREKDELQMQLFKKTDIYKNLHNKINGKLTDKEKKELITTIDNLWPEFRISFKILSSKVSAEEIFMCCLLKANFKCNEIASWMNIEENSVSMKRKRLAQKLFGETATVNDLENFIFPQEIPSGY